MFKKLQNVLLTLTLWLGVSAVAFGQTANGVVVDAQGQPIPGAGVIVKGTATGTMTGSDGKFVINAQPGTTLEISCIGYATVSVAAKTNLRIVLQEDVEFLDDVVVVGYGTQKKANLTGAVSTVDVGRTLSARPMNDVAKSLQGAVPGLTIMSNSGNLGASPTLQIRGLGTLSNEANSSPLIIVDGVPMDDLSYLNPQDIDAVSVLKDAASASIYGSRAAFGVILITTKSGQKGDKVSVTYSNNFGFKTPTVLPKYASAYDQMVAFREAKIRRGATPELFGMVITEDYIAKTREWEERHNWTPAGYREVVLGDDLDVALDYTYMDASGNFIHDPNSYSAAALKEKGWTLMQSPGQANYYADWDVAGIFYKTWTPSQNHNLSVQGTTGRASYYLSIGFDKEEGTQRFHPDQLKKWNVAGNVKVDVNKWLQVGGRFNFEDRTYTQGYCANTGMGQGTLQYVWRWGSFFGPYGTYNGNDFRTIAYMKQDGDDVNKGLFTRMTGFAKIQLAKGLTLNADFTYNIYDSDRKYQEKAIYGINNWSSIAAADDTGKYAVSPTWMKTYNAIGQQGFRSTSYVFNAYADYVTTFNQDHNFHAMVGVNAESGESSRFVAYRQNLLDASLPEFALATGTQNVYNPDLSSYPWRPSHRQWATAGYFARVNYDYKGIYLLEINGRLDGSSRFPSTKHWGFFPSASAGYHFSEEEYFAPLKQVVSNGKFRVSFGEIGNEAIGENMFVSTISSGNANWVGAGSSKLSQYGMPSLVSNELSWERIRTLDLGLDMGFLNNELTLGFDWYERNTMDMLAPAVSMPATLGAAAPYRNNGTLRTRGWELSLGWNHVFNNDLLVYANVNIGDAKSVVTKWDNDARLINSTYEGKVYGDIWGFETDRLFTPEDFTGFDAKGNPTGYAAGVASQVGLQNTDFIYGVGDTKYKDLDGNGVIDGGKGTAEDHGDLKVIGNMMPRYQYSFRLGAAWKGFDIDMFFQGVGKRDVWSQSSMVFPTVRNADATLFANETDYWKGSFENGKWTTTTGYNTTYARLFSGGNDKGTVAGIDNGNANYYPQSKYLTHMAYLRLKNLTIGYTLPESLTKKVSIEKVRIYFSGENLFELINKANGPFDPETGGMKPTSGTGGSGSHTNSVFGRVDPFYRTLSFGIQVTL